MKSGKLSRSNEAPKEGFSFRREGYEIVISYIEPTSITKKDKRYEYIQYIACTAATSYEELVNKCVSLKYSIEMELSLTSKAIADPLNEEYAEYRKYVDSCKDACKSMYEKLGLVKKEI